MKSLLISIAFSLMFVFSAYGQINTTGLTEEQKAEIELQVAKLKSKKTDPQAVVERYSEYAELGEKIGIAISNVAGEVGKSADQFLETTSGKFVVAVILYRVVGDDIVSIFLGLLWFFIMIPSIIAICFKLTGKKTKGYLEKLNPDTGKVVSREYPEIGSLDGDTKSYIAGVQIIGLVIFVLACAAGFIIIA